MKVHYNVSILSEAEIDLDTYETRQSGLGDRFFDSVNKSLLAISKSPMTYQEIYKGIRRCVIQKFPYGVYYKVLPDVAEIQVLGIVHFKRNPKVVKKRL